MRLRKLAFSVHLYAGMFAGILLAAIGLTGSLLVFAPEIDLWLHPQLLQVAPQGERVSLEIAVSAVKKAYPQHQPVSLLMPQKRDGVYQVSVLSPEGDLIEVCVNPYSAAILGARRHEETFTGFLLAAHTQLFAGEIGATAVGICGFLLLALAATGLFLWPGWRQGLWKSLSVQWRAALPIPGMKNPTPQPPPRMRGGGERDGGSSGIISTICNASRADWRRLNFDLHSAAGTVFALSLTLIASTGAAMIFHTEFEGMVNALSGTKPLAALTVKPQKGAVALDEIVGRAGKALPGAATTLISFGATPEAAVRVRKKFPAEASPNGNSAVWIDPYSGEILRAENALSAPVKTRILNAVYPLHTGSAGGLPLRAAHAAAGLAPALLFVTGAVMWRQRQWAKARRQEALGKRQELLPVAQQWPWF